MLKMLSSIIAIVTTAIAVLTLIFSVLRDKKQLATQMITMHRMDWIREVRALLADFACEYIKNNHKSSEKLFELKTKIELYMRPDKLPYRRLLDHMAICCNQDYSETNYRMLMLYSSEILARPWQRIVIEGKGHVLLSNKRIVALVDKNTSELSKMCGETASRA